MMRIETHEQEVTEDELAAVIAAALAASQDGLHPSPGAGLASLDESSLAAVIAGMAAAGIPLHQAEEPLLRPNEAWRRPPHEQSVRPRWR